MVQANLSDTDKSAVLEAKTFLVARAAKNIYNRLGTGHERKVYESALCKEFQAHHIQFSGGEIHSNRQSAGSGATEFCCFGELMVHLTTNKVIKEDECRRLAQELAMINLPAGLIINFGSRHLQMKRILA